MGNGKSHYVALVDDSKVILIDAVDVDEVSLLILWDELTYGRLLA